MAVRQDGTGKKKKGHCWQIDIIDIAEEFIGRNVETILVMLEES